MKRKALLSALLIAALLLCPLALMEEASTVDTPVPVQFPASVEAELPQGLSEVELPEEIEAARVDETVEAEVVDFGAEDAEGPTEYEAEDFSEGMNAPAYYASAGSVAIDGTNFPDSAFRECIKSEFDTDGNNVLSADEISRAEGIQVRGAASLKGVEYFTNLITLDANGCQLTDLDVRSNTKLQTLHCSNSQLTTLDLQSNTALEGLFCSSNRLTALDVRNNAELAYLECEGNALTSLDISNNKKLESLSCYGNSLSALDVGNHPNLEYLDCNSNQLTELDVRNNPKLIDLVCYDNKLSALDVSNNAELMCLDCSGNSIATLDISNCKNILTAIKKQYIYNDPASEGHTRYIYVQGHVDIIFDCDNAVNLITTATATTPQIAPLPTPSVAPSIIVRSRTKYTATVGNRYQINLEGATARSYKSSRNKVATVDSNGLITAKAAGKTRITVKVGRKRRYLTLTVVDPTIPTYVQLNLSGTYAANVGDSVTLTTTMSEGAVSGIKWKTSNRRVATVTSTGEVTFWKKGKVTITATTTRGKKKAKVKFRVS